jgi:hypothetical protein
VAIREFSRCECCGRNRRDLYYRDLGKFGFPATRKRRLRAGLSDANFAICDECAAGIELLGRSHDWVKRRLPR